MTNGAWGVIAHLRSLQVLDQYEIVAVANSTVESAQKSIKHHGLPAGTKAYGTPEDIANDPNVDLVVVSVNVQKHFSLAKPALEQKKNVFVEWPLGASVAEAEELTRLAKTNDVKAFVGVQARADPSILKVKEIIASKKIGKIISSTATATTGALPVDTWMKGGEYYLDFKSGGNEFTIYFGHFLDTFTYVLGDFADVHGLLKAQYKTTSVVDLSNGQIVDPAYPKTSPDHIFVQGTLESDAVASIAFRKAHSAADSTGFRWIITGTDGELVVTAPEGHFQFTSEQWSLKLKTGRGQAVEYEEIPLTGLDKSPASKVQFPGTNIARVYQSFANGDGLEASFESATKTHRLLGRIAKSAGWEFTVHTVRSPPPGWASSATEARSADAVPLIPNPEAVDRIATPRVAFLVNSSWASPTSTQPTTATMAPRIEASEVETYWNIFSTRTNGGKFLTGEQAAPLLKNSGLRDDQLERVWDVSDIDNDGNLDFEEFCVAMRIIFDIVNGEYADVPNTLPDWLVPESKAHLIQATRALTGKQVAFEQVDDDSDTPGLKDGFDWYMNPKDKAKYESIYQESRDMRGEVSFNALEDLYESLDVPDTDIRSAWNLINPSASSTINKDACLAFLHILNNRHEGFRIPRTVPASLRSSFERKQINYQLDSERDAPAASRWAAKADDTTSTGRKAKFGDQYLTRLGRSGFKTGGTDFSTAKTDDWEEVRLKKQLAELEDKMAKVEEMANRRRGGQRDSKPALVKRELEQLLDYKRKELRELEEGGGKAQAGTSLRGVADDLATVKEQVDGLEAHLSSRLQILEQLRREIEDEKTRR
ncbi:uncharacterized protein JN550_002279 [Neoarthrinium moseri]|uniref:uncharacterized protein n=1 Tax=Neoarthrinium moseri TaxID=1658444 RepID=UPI001FDB12D9|nr:uncharacterized protein JN550_002279 [Neoarthrinium moseri]KAI1874850.1 hypothetical protein JN550_002279 [Neoarthrinium moseri]